MVTHNQIVESELAQKAIEIFNLKIQLANFSNENEQLKAELDKIRAFVAPQNQPINQPVTNSPFVNRNLGMQQASDNKNQL